MDRHCPGDRSTNDVVTVVGGDNRLELRPATESRDCRWICTEQDGYYGFICRASTASNHGAYLGYGTDEYLQCRAQFQKKWEHMNFIKVSDGLKWVMPKDERMAYIAVVESNRLKIVASDLARWGLTEV